MPTPKTRSGASAGGKPESHTPTDAPRHIPPRKPLGVVSGVLESPWASSHSTLTSGTRAATAGKVERQIVQSDDVRTGNAPASRVLPTNAPARSMHAREPTM